MPTTDAFPRTRRVLDAALDAGSMPGLALEVWCEGTPRLSLALGQRALRPTPAPMVDGTWFDLASLTKVMATLPVILTLAEDGAFGLDEPVCRFLPDLRGEHERYTLRHLLAHVAGLPSGLPWRELDPDRARYPAFLAARRLEHAPGDTVVYSDVGFILLGLVAEAVTGQPLRDLARDRVHGPLGAQMRYGPIDGVGVDVAATSEPPDRDGPPTGTVHDEVSRRLGGGTGHAGLFGTARGVVQVAEMFRRRGVGLNGARVLAPQTVDACLRPASRTGEGNRRALGFELTGGPNSAGDLLSARAFGHTGFTGTSAWVDPDLALTVALLTNRVHLGRDNQDILAVRKRVHNAVVADLARADRPDPV